jgi:hypothetical protein
MKIDTLKTLEKLIKLSRKLNVLSMEVDGVKFLLGAEPTKEHRPIELPQDPLELAVIPEPNIYDPIAQAKAVAARATQAIKDRIDTPDDLSEEQLMNYSIRDNAFESAQ